MLKCYWIKKLIYSYIQIIYMFIMCVHINQRGCNLAVRYKKYRLLKYKTGATLLTSRRNTLQCTPSRQWISRFHVKYQGSLHRSLSLSLSATLTPVQCFPGQVYYFPCMFTTSFLWHNIMNVRDVIMGFRSSFL